MTTLKKPSTLLFFFIALVSVTNSLPTENSFEMPAIDIHCPMWLSCYIIEHVHVTDNSDLQAAILQISHATMQELRNEAFIIAARYGHTEVAKLLLNNGVDLSHGDYFAIQLIAGRGTTEMGELLITNAELPTHIKSEIMFLAVTFNHSNFVQLLLECNFPLLYNGQLVLEIAIEENRPDIVRTLLRWSMDPDNMPYTVQIIENLLSLINTEMEIDSQITQDLIEYKEFLNKPTISAQDLPSELLALFDSTAPHIGLLPETITVWRDELCHLMTTFALTQDFYSKDQLLSVLLEITQAIGK